jgi:hypothetical protein
MAAEPLILALARAPRSLPAMWTIAAVNERFGEDVLRDLCRDINDLKCGRAGYGHHPNRIGVPEPLWRKLLAAGGYNESGVEKAVRQENLRQEETVGPFTPFTMLTLVNLVEDQGGPLAAEELDTVITCALRYRQLI